MACVITLDGKKYDEAGFKQLLASGFLANEINSGVLKDSKSEIYKQYINGNVTKEVSGGEAQQTGKGSPADNQKAQGEGESSGEVATGSEGSNTFYEFGSLTEEQIQDLTDAVDEINNETGGNLSPREAYFRLKSYFGQESFPFILNMKNAVLAAVDQGRISSKLKELAKQGKTQIRGSYAKTRVGRTLSNLKRAMKSFGIDVAVLSDEDFDQFFEEAYGLSPKNQNAFYAWGAKTMVLKKSNSQQIALHEFIHPILAIIDEVDPNVYNSLVAAARNLDGTSSDPIDGVSVHPDGITFSDWAQKNYGGAHMSTIDNEMLTELVSILANKRVSMSSPLGQLANKVWRDILDFFGIKSASINIKVDDDLTISKLAKAIAEAAITSRSIKVQDVAGVEIVAAEGISSSKNSNLISEAGLSKYMTEDGEGNYVFYHISTLDLTKKGIDPNKLGSNRRTGRDEVMGKHPVSMYYTEPDIADVYGDYKHVVMIPKNKVYPVDQDPLNLRPIAEKEFRKVFPIISFDSDRASSWIAKVAADKGYEIIVASWSPRRNFKALRAESVIKHKPKLYEKPSGGLGYGVTVDEKYEFESNRKSVKRKMDGADSPGVIAGGQINKKGISSSRVSTTPAATIYSTKKISKLPVKSVEQLYDKYNGKAIVINSDPTRVGELTLPSGKKIFMYGGPEYLSIKENVDGGVGFATTQVSKVKTWKKYADKLFGKGKSLTYVATQAPISVLSNSYALRYVMDAISTLPKSVLKSSEFKSEFFGKDLLLLKNAFGERQYKEFISKYKNADLSNPEVIDAMISEMAYKIGDDNKPASFKARRAFVSNLLGGIDSRSKSKSIEGDVGYYSKSPNKFIAKKLYEKHGLNVEKLMYEIGRKDLVDLYMNEGKWGFLVSGFETDPSIKIDSVQPKGIKHPLFNAKFPSSEAFMLDGAYEVDKLFTPIPMQTKKKGLYMKKASTMLASSMYVKGEKTSEGGSFEYSKSEPTSKGKGISSSRSTPVQDLTPKFAESAKLLDQIQEADGAAKKRRLAEERRALIESSPELKLIDDNIKNIYEQLENKGVLTREGNCL